MIRRGYFGRITASICLLAALVILSSCGAILDSLLKDRVENDDEICRRECSHVGKANPGCLAECKAKAERAKMEEHEKRVQERLVRERVEKREQERAESDKVVTDRVLKSLDKALKSQGR